MSALLLYRKPILVAGAAGLLLGLVFAVVASQLELDSRLALALTLSAISLNALLLLALGKAFPALFPTRGVLLESLLAQLLLFFSAWTAAYNLLP